MKADYCLKSKAVFTGESEKTIEGCVLVRRERILDVVPFGKEAEYIGEYTKVIDYGGRLLMPGFIDAHTHFFSGAIAASEHVCMEIADSTSEEECVRMVLEFAKAHPNEKRIRGHGWFVTNWGDAPLPTKASLDAVLPDIPVYLQAADVHSYWLNSAALKECGIMADMEVSSGYIGRLDNGELSGMLVEMEACEPADKMYRSFTEEELHEIYLDFLKKAARAGVTSMSEMSPGEYDEEHLNQYRAIRALEEQGQLSLRLHVFTKLYDTEDFSTALKWKENLDSDYLKISGVKGFVDGVVETYTGLLLEPYTDWPDTCGINVPIKPQEELTASVIRANKAGLPVRIHCIADGSVRMALDAFEASVKMNGRHLANTIEHVESIHPADIGRFKELGVIPSMQPIHMILDADGKINRIGKERIQYEWPVKTLLDDCGELALGTDYPVVDISPFDNIYAAVTRRFFDGKAATHNEWEKLSVGEALKAYTSGAARAYSREHEIGTLKKNMFADIIVLDRNLFEISAEDIPDTKIEMTMVGGKMLLLE